MALWIKQPPFFARSGRGRFVVLSAVVILAAILLAMPFLASSPSGPGAETHTGVISPQAAHELAQSGAVTIIDVRRPDEWRATGTAPGAKRATIDIGRNEGRFLDRIKKLTQGDKNAPVALICAAGVRSKHAATLLRKQGYTSVSDVGEGMVGGINGIGWIKQGLPVSACGTC